MPNIPSFDAGPLALHPTEIGIDATAGAARRVGAFFNQQAGAEEQLARETERLGSQTEQLGSEKANLLTGEGARLGSAVTAAGDAAVKVADHQQISHGATAYAGLMAGLTQQWNDTVKNADPNDATLAQRFREQTLEPQLEEFKKGFWTEGAQQWAEAHVDALRNHIVEKTSADMSTLAGQAAVVNQQKTINSLSSAVHGDPSSLDFALAALKSATEGVISTSPNITGVEAGRVRSEILQKGAESIVKSAAIGSIAKTGEVPAWASDPKYSPYINGAELKQFQQTARYYQSNIRAEQRWNDAQTKENERRDFNARINSLEQSTFPQNVGDPPQLPKDYWQKLRDLVIHPGASLEPGRLAAMASKGEAITSQLNKPEPLGPLSHETTMQVLGDIRSGKITDNGPIYQAYQEGKLNRADFGFLQSEFGNLRTPEGQRLESDRKLFMSRYDRLIDGAMNDTGQHSLLGTQMSYKFEMDARQQEQTLRQQGRDPHGVYDPRSPDFFGRPENIANYRVSYQDAQKYESTLKSMDKANAAGTPTAAPGPAKGIPPANQRSPGLYDTPKGRLRWTGAGWVSP